MEAHQALRKSRILIADNSVTVQKMVYLAFATSSYEVITASDGSDAMQKIRTLKPKVVLADVDLEEMNGHALCQKLRDDRSLSTITKIVLMYSRPIEKADELRSMSVGANKAIAKPFEAEALFKLVDDLANTPYEEVQVHPAIEVPSLNAADQTPDERVVGSDGIAPGVGNAVPQTLAEAAPSAVGVVVAETASSATASPTDPAPANTSNHMENAMNLLMGKVEGVENSNVHEAADAPKLQEITKSIQQDVEVTTTSSSEEVAEVTKITDKQNQVALLNEEELKRVLDEMLDRQRERWDALVDQWTEKADAHLKDWIRNRLPEIAETLIKDEISKIRGDSSK